MKKEKYIVRIFRKVFAEGNDRYWFNIPKYIQVRDSLGLGGSQIRTKMELAEEDESKHRSSKSISRVNKFCEGDLSNLNGKDQSVTIDTIKGLGKALCDDACAFLILIEQASILNTVEMFEGVSDRNDLKYVYNLLNKILYELEMSSYYAVKPGTQEEGYTHYDMRIQEIRKEIDSRFWNEPETRERLYRLVEEEEITVKSFSVPGVPERWAQMNPAIRYFDCVFDIVDSEPELYERIKNGECSMQDGQVIGFQFYPTPEECLAREKYFEAIREKAEKSNLNYSFDRLYQNELVNTFAIVFENDFGE